MQVKPDMYNTRVVMEELSFYIYLHMPAAYYSLLLNRMLGLNLSDNEKKLYLIVFEV